MIFPPYQTTCFFIPLVTPCTPLLTQKNTHQISTQISVSPDGGGKSVGKKRNGENKGCIKPIDSKRKMI